MGGKDIDLMIKNKSIDLYSSFQAKLFTPYIFFPGNSLPNEYRKYRITFNVGEIIIQPNIRDKPIIFNIDFSRAFSEKTLKEHLNTWRLAEILFNSKEFGCLVELNSQNKTPITLELNYEIGEAIDFHIIENALIVENLWYLSRYFDFDQELIISFEKIIEQKHIISILRNFSDRDGFVGYISFTTTKILPENNNKLAILFSISLKFIDTIIDFFIGITGNNLPQNQQNKCFIAIDNPKIIHISKNINSIRSKSNKNDISSKIVQGIETKGYFCLQLDEINKISFNDVEYG